MTTDSFMTVPANSTATEEDIWSSIPDVDRQRQEFYRLVGRIYKAG